MSYRSKPNSQHSRELAKSTNHFSHLQSRRPVPTSMLNTDIHATPKKKSNYLQQEYQTLKDRIRSVEQKNAVILRRIKDNMVTVVESDEDTYFDKGSSQIIKLTMPGQPFPNIHSDYPDSESSESQQSCLEVFRLPVKFQQSVYLPVIQKSIPVSDNPDPLKKDQIQKQLQKQIQLAQSSILARMSYIFQKVKTMDTKFSLVDQLVLGLKQQINLSHCQQHEHDTVTQVKERQRQLLIQDCKGKIKKLESEVEHYERRILNYENTIEDTNQTIRQRQKTIKDLKTEYQMFKGESELQKFKFEHKLVQITSNKNFQIESLEKKLYEAMNLGSQQFKTANSSTDSTKQRLLKSELQDQKAQIQELHKEVERINNQKKTLQSSIENKSNELKTASYQLMETQMMSNKIKQMFQDLQQDYQKLDLEKHKKESQYMESFKAIRQTAKSKQKQLTEKVNQLLAHINDCYNKIPRKTRKSIEQLTPEECLKSIANCLQCYEKRQTLINESLSNFLNVSPLQIEMGGYAQVFQRLSLKIKEGSRKIIELQQLDRQSSRLIKSKRDASPIASMRRSNILSPKNQCNCLNYQNQIREKKKQIFRFIEQGQMQSDQNQHLKKKLELLNNENNENREKIVKLIGENRKLVQDIGKLQAELISTKTGEMENASKAFSRNKLLEASLGQQTQKNKQLEKENDSLSKKISSMEVSHIQQITKYKKLKQEKQRIEAQLKQKLADKKEALQKLIQEKNCIKIQLKVAKQKLDIQDNDEVTNFTSMRQSYEFQQNNPILEELKRDLEKKEKQINEAENRSRQMAKKKTEIQGNLRVSISQSKIFEAQKNIEVQTLKQQIEKVRSAYESQAEKRRKEIVKLSDKIKELQVSLKHKNEQVSSLDKQLAELKKKQKGSKEESSKKTYKIQNLQSEVKILRDKLNQASKVNEEILKINHSIETQLNENSQQNQLRVSALQREINNLKQQLKNKENLCHQLKQKIKSISEELDSAKQLYREYKNKVQRDLSETQKQISKHTTVEQDYEAKIHRLSSLNMEQKSYIQLKQKKTQSYNENLQEKNNQIKRLENTLELKENEIFQLIQKINELKYSLMDDLDNKSEYIRQIRTDYDNEKQILKEKLQLLQRELDSAYKQMQQRKIQSQNVVNSNEKLACRLNLIQKQNKNLALKLEEISKKDKTIENQLQQAKSQAKKFNLENETLKRNLQELEKQIQDQDGSKRQFIEEIDKQHQHQIKVLENRIKKQEINLKSVQQALMEKEKMLNRKDIELQIAEQKVVSEKKWKESLQNQLNAKNNQIQSLKNKLEKQSEFNGSLAIEEKIQSNINNDSPESSPSKRQVKTEGKIESKGELKMESRTDPEISYGQNQFSVTSEYIKRLKEQVMAILTRERCEFSQGFINLHRADTAYELSLFRCELVKKNMRHSILEELEFAGNNGLDFISRLDEEIDDVVNGLEERNGQHTDKNHQIQQFKAIIRNHQHKIQQLKDSKQKDTVDLHKMIDFLQRQVTTLRKHSDTLSNGMTDLEKCIKKVLEITFGSQNRVLELKQTFEKIENLYQDIMGQSNTDFTKFRQAYFGRVKQQQRSRSKRKGWF